MSKKLDMQERRGQLEDLPTSDLLKLALHYDSDVGTRIAQFRAYHDRPNAGENDGSGYVIYEPPSLEDCQRFLQNAAEFEAVRLVLCERGRDIKAAVVEHLNHEEMEVREHGAYAMKYRTYPEQESYVEAELAKRMPLARARVEEIIRKVF